MIDGMSEETRIEAIQALMKRQEYVECVLEPLCDTSGHVQIDSNAVANLILHCVLNQLTIMSTLKALLLKEGEKVVPMPDPEKEESDAQV